MKYLAFFSLLVWHLTSFAQKSVNHRLVFHPMFGDSVLKEATYYQINSNDSIQITALKFYISGLELSYQHKTVWKEKNSYHLMDAFQEGSLTLPLPLPAKLKYDRVKFNLGIDSVTSVSGVMGGDLDPTKGMYWTWQSGYINFKLEGNSNLCKTRNTEFQFHLGGYQFPHNNLQSIFMDMPHQKLDVVIDIKKMVGDLPLTQMHHIMSPGNEAMLLTETVINAMRAKK
ncbi:MAG: MbnP family protein [Bacteroidota bacterium]